MGGRLASPCGARLAAQPIESPRRCCWRAGSVIVCAMLALAAFASLSLPGLARAENPKTPEIIATYFSNSLTKVVQFGSSKAWLAIDSVDGVIYRTGDRGRSWSEIKDIPRGLATYLHVHPFDDDTAFVLGEGTKHYVTHDRGQTWTQFTTPLPPISNGEKPLRFHAGRVDSILFSGERCVEDNRWWLPRLNCHEETFYTTEGFRHSNSRSLESLLGEGVPVRQCQWARLKTEFKEMPEQTIMCLVPPDGSDAGPARRSSRLVWEKRFDSTQSISNATGATSREEAASMPQRAPLYSQRHNLFDFGLRDGGNKSTGLRLAISQDYFATKRVVSFGGGDQTGGGVIGVNVVSRFIIAAVQHARSEETDLFVSLDGHTWAESRLPLPAGVSENAYTLLESTPHALLIDVVMSSGSYGTIFKSNSNGTYYTPSLAHAYRNKNGLVDVERVQGLEGVILANQVSNWDKFDWRHGWHFLNRPEIQTRISFDDGAHWSYLRAPTHGLDGKGYGCTEDGWRIGDCALHVHSVTSVHNPGFVYSTKASPGIIMAVGSVGKHLASWKDCDTFLSTDGGLTWKQVHKDAHLYEFVDSGSTLLLVNNEGPTDTAVYSVDRGETWHEVRLGERIHAYATINDNLGIDNGLMILGRVSDGNNKGKFVVLSVGFEGVWSRQCDFNPEDPKENDDIEKWVLRADKNSECVMGHKAIHFRRRAAAQCYMDATRVSLPVSEDCPCEEKDYECDYNYALDPSTGKCVLVGPEVIPRGQCQREGDRFMASPGYRLIPGDTCDYERGKQLDRPVDKACPRAIDAPSGGVVTHSLTTFRHSIVIDPFVNSTHYLLHSSNGDVFLSKDEGISWERVDLSNVVDSNDRALAVVKHGYVASRAFVYMVSGVMVVTDDFGVTWRRMDKLPAPVNGLAITPIFSFHPDRPDWMLYMGGTECPKCHTEVYLTKDGGRVWNKVTTHAEKCLFAHANRFVSLPEDAVLCSVWKYKSGKKGYQDIVREEAPPENLLQLLVFDDPIHDNSRVLEAQAPVEGEDRHEDVNFLNDFYVHAHFIIAVMEVRMIDEDLKRHSELQIQVSVDGKSIAVTQFPPNVPPLRPGSISIINVESEPSTIFVNVERSSFAHININEGWGTLFASNSNGTYFHRVLENTHRNVFGVVGVEPIRGLDGVWIANQVMNTDSMGKPGVNALVRTVMSWDGGRTWHVLRAPTKDAEGRDLECKDCTLNLHDRIDAGLSGHVFGVPTAPGLLMGVGSVGPHLSAYRRSKTYLSRNGGRTWVETRGIETMHEFGDHGGILVTIDNEGPTNELWYSTNHGATWATYQFTDGERLRIEEVSSGITQGGTTFTIVGRRLVSGHHGRFGDVVVVSVDFSKLHKRACQYTESDGDQSDFELWSPGPPNAADQACYNGQQASYWRRKQDAACFVGREFEPPKTVKQTCECTEADFECEAGFWPNDAGKCVLEGPDPYQPKDCLDGTKYIGKSGYKKRPSSVCRGGVDLEHPVERVCGLSGGAGAAANIMDAEIISFQYFKHSPHIMAHTAANEAHVSLDEGATWRPLMLSDAPATPISDVLAILRNPYFEGYAVIVTMGHVHYITADEGRSAKAIHVPDSPHAEARAAFAFHPEQPEWMLYSARSESCPSQLAGPGGCPAKAYISRDLGDTWDELMAMVGPTGCNFMRTDKLLTRHPRSVVCQVPREHGDRVDRSENPYDIVVVEDVFHRSPKVLLEGALDFGTIDKYLIMTRSTNNEKHLQMFITEDGEQVAVAHFPGEKHHTDPAYTLLPPSKSGGVLMLHVTKSLVPSQEWGAIYASNSNGTYFRLSLENVNRDEQGQVDFERIESLEGAALANVVANAGDLEASRRTREARKRYLSARSADKQLRTVMTMDNGASWHYLNPPSRDSEGRRYPCRSSAPSDGSCALHLHGYTELFDPVNIYSGSGAPGVLIGMGNVGSYLGPMRNASTFLSRDGGHVWTEIQKGAYWHEIGDHGVILVLADRLHATDHVLYSIDDGATWMRLSLGLPDNQKMLIDTLTTEPQSTSRKFMVLGRLSGDKYAAVRLDFSGVQPRRCFFDPEDELNGKNLDDFELWSPRGMGRVGQTLDEQLCVLGHQVQYYRRIPGRACYVGRKFTKPRMLVKNCSCTRHDYECDYNYVPNNKTSKCELVPGMKGLRTECVPGKSEYFTISNGYRRIPQSTCEGGLKLDTPTTVWCPGKARTVAAFWIVFLPIAFVLCGYGGYALWRRYHNPPYGRLGVPPRGGPRAFVEHTVFGRAKATVKAATMVMSEFILDTLDRVGPYLPRPVQNLLQSGMRGLGGSHDDGALRLGSRIALEADDDDLDPLEDPRQLSANVLGVSRRAAQARYAYQPLNTRDASFGSLPTNHGLIGEDGLGEGEEDYEDDQHAVYLDEDSAATPHHTTESSQQQQQQSGTWIIDNEYANLDVVSSEEGDEVHQDNSP